MDILQFVAVGFVAQLVDGALGMAFGVISSTILVVLGVPPAAASASVHAAEVVTTGVSGTAHALVKNIDWRLFRRIVIPGVIGGALGAFVLSNIHADVARPFVLAYLMIIAAVLLYRGLTFPPKPKDPKVAAPLGLVGGFLDAAGGGGWGPIVTSNLLLQGGSPRSVVGSVNLAEFFVTVTISATFIASLGFEAFTRATVGLLIGGVLAAPFGAILVKRLSARQLLLLVGIILIGTSGYGLYRYMA